MASGKWDDFLYRLQGWVITLASIARDLFILFCIIVCAVGMVLVFLSCANHAAVN